MPVEYKSRGLLARFFSEQPPAKAGGFGLRLKPDRSAMQPIADHAFSPCSRTQSTPALGMDRARRLKACVLRITYRGTIKTGLREAA